MVWRDIAQGDEQIPIELIQQPYAHNILITPEFHPDGYFPLKGVLELLVVS